MTPTTYTPDPSIDFNHPSGTVSASILSVSAAEIALTISDFSFDKYKDFFFIIKETEFPESSLLPFIRKEDSIIFDPASLRGLFEFRRSKEFHIYIRAQPESSTMEQFSYLH